MHLVGNPLAPYYNEWSRAPGGIEQALRTVQEFMELEDELRSSRDLFDDARRKAWIRIALGSHPSLTTFSSVLTRALPAGAYAWPSLDTIARGESDPSPAPAATSDRSQTSGL